jgi:uncharacterized protein (DUF2236 family)
MWVAGFRALYLQALHPRVMRGTWQNTAFADPKQAWGRFLRTIEYVQTRTYGSHAEVERAGRRIRKLHASLRGTDPDGTQFRLDEPELLLWVHCGEIGSYLDVARRCGMGLTSAEMDTYVDEQRRSAQVVGLDPARVPGSAAELAGYFESMRPRLHATGEARRALLRSLSPALPRQLMPLKLVMPGVTTLAFATLPRWARRLYRMPGSPLADVTATASLRALREATTGKPGQLLIMPAAHNMGILQQWLAVWTPRAIDAARKLQPLWSQPDAKPPRFEDGLDAAKARFTGVLSDLGLDTPKELAQ